MQISQVMTSYTQPNFDQIWWRYLSQFVSKLFDSLQYDATKSAPQYEPNSFVTMATYWVPDLPNIKGTSGTFSVPFSYLQMVPHMHDSAGI